VNAPACGRVVESVQEVIHALSLMYRASLGAPAGEDESSSYLALPVPLGRMDWVSTVRLCYVEGAVVVACALAAKPRT
jgi:hypothetical protein